MLTNIVSKIKVGALLGGVVITTTKMSDFHNTTKSTKTIEETWWKKKAFADLTAPISIYNSER